MEKLGTEESFVEHVADQAGLGDRLVYKKMFGEYGIYVDGKFTALACDNSLFIKPTPAVEALGIDFPLRAPYTNGKPHPVIDELLDDPEKLKSLLLETARALPEPKLKKPRKRKAGEP